jgi:hypothetical protein
VDQAKLQAFLQQATGEGVVIRKAALTKEYQAHIRAQYGSTDYLLRGVTSDEGKAKIIVSYAVWMYLEGFRGRQVTDRMAAVQSYMDEHVVDTRFFEMKCIQKARTAARRNASEVREAAVASQENVKLPSPEALIDSTRQEAYLDEADYSFDAMEEKGVSLALTIALVIGARPSNIVGGGGKKKKRKFDESTPSGDHRMITTDLVFSTADGRKVFAGTELNGLPAGSVTGAEVRLFTHKGGIASTIAKQLGGTQGVAGGARANLVRDLEAWSRNSGVQDGEGFFTMYRMGQQKKNPRMGRREITQKDLREQIKRAAVLNGLPANHFSLSSMRKGFATNASLMGVPMEQIQETGEWSQGSRVTGDHYDHSGQLAPVHDTRLARRPLTVADVQSMVPHVSDKK